MSQIRRQPRLSARIAPAGSYLLGPEVNQGGNYFLFSFRSFFAPSFDVRLIDFLQDLWNIVQKRQLGSAL
jgi:hypothetical protein